jgi:hypothetical protein
MATPFDGTIIGPDGANLWHMDFDARSTRLGIAELGGDLKCGCGAVFELSPVAGGKQ